MSVNNPILYDNKQDVKLALHKVQFASKENDPVDPNHYKHVPGVECKDVIGYFSCFVGTAIKYLWRCGHKPGVSAIEDLRKAIKNIEFEIERIEKENKIG